MSEADRQEIFDLWFYQGLTPQAIALECEMTVREVMQIIREVGE